MEGFLASVFLSVFMSLESWDFMRAALFLWITFFLTARSAKETAFLIFSGRGDFFAVLTAISRPLTMILLTASLFFEPLRALLAVFVTGITNVIIYETYA